MSVRLTYKDEYQEVSIELVESGLTGATFVDDLVRPLMLGVGYHPNTIAQALGDEEPGNE